MSQSTVISIKSYMTASTFSSLHLLTLSRLIPDSENNRRDIFRKARSLEAFKAEKVLQTWRVQFERRIVQGEPSDGHVALAYRDNKLNLYFAKRSVDSRKSREELTELLLDF